MTLIFPVFAGASVFANISTVQFLAHPFSMYYSAGCREMQLIHAQVRDVELIQKYSFMCG